MPAQTFRDVWSSVLLHAPTVPVALAQKWVQDGYDKLIANRHWAWTRRQTTLTTQAARAVTVGVQQGSTTITSAGQFVAGDAGRQIRCGTDYIYTIDTFQDVNTVLLTQPYAETSGTKAATISDIYLLMPEDFRSFYTVQDLVNSRPICWWISGERLDLYDPARQAADSRFRVLVSHQISQRQATFGRVGYEAWPHPTAAGTYILTYFTRMDALANDTPFQGVLATFTKALETYALSEAALWPGTPTQRNPYFNLRLAEALNAEFEKTYQELDVMDDDQYLMNLQQIDLAAFGLASISASTSLLQRTDADVSDYFGGFR